MKPYDLTPVAELLTEEAAPDHFAKNLDDACFNIANQCIQHRDDGSYGEPDEQLFYLRKLRDAMLAIHKQQKQ